jgi:hypothetical protein
VYPVGKHSTNREFGIVVAHVIEQEAKGTVNLGITANVLDLVAQTGQESTMPREARVEFATRQ